MPCGDALYLPQLVEFSFVGLVCTVLFTGGSSFPDVTVAGTSVPRLTHVADAEVPLNSFKSVFVALTLSTNRPLAHCKYIMQCRTGALGGAHHLF